MNRLRNIFLTLMLVCGLVSPLFTEAARVAVPRPDGPEVDVEVGDGRVKPIRGYYFFEEDGEQVLMLVLADVTVFPPMKFKNKKEEEFYWKTVRDVKKTLPYAKLICETLIETYEYIETFPTQKEREDHLKKMEGEVFKQYKPALKKFTKSQAQMLVKLINRETDQSSYNILKAFLGSFRAGFADFRQALRCEPQNRLSSGEGPQRCDHRACGDNG